MSDLNTTAPDIAPTATSIQPDINSLPVYSDELIDSVPPVNNDSNKHHGTRAVSIDASANTLNATAEPAPTHINDTSNNNNTNNDEENDEEADDDNTGDVGDTNDSASDDDDTPQQPIQSSKNKKKKRYDAVSLGLIDDEVEVSEDEVVSDDEDDNIDQDGFIDNLVASESDDDIIHDTLQLTREEKKALKAERREKKRLKRERLGIVKKRGTIDDDDYDLLVDAGIKINRSIDDDVIDNDTSDNEQRKYKRIKKNVRIYDDSVNDVSMNNMQNNTASNSNNIDDMFDDDDNGNENQQQLNDINEDDFIVNDMDTTNRNNNKISVSQSKSIKSKPPSQRDRYSPMDTSEQFDDELDESSYLHQSDGIDTSQLERLFGRHFTLFLSSSNTNQVVDIDELDDQYGDEGDADNDEILDSDTEQTNITTSKIKRKSDPIDTVHDAATHAAARAAALEQYNEHIRTVDIPERYQSRVTRRNELYGTSYDRQYKELNYCSDWIYDRYFSEHDHITQSDVTQVLYYIRVELLEIPYIICYRSDYIGKLTEDDIWLIDTLDQQYDDTAHKRSVLIQQCQSLDVNVDIVDIVKYDWNDQIDLDDVSDYIQYVRATQPPVHDTIKQLSIDEIDTNQSTHGVVEIGHTVPDTTGPMNDTNIESYTNNNSQPSENEIKESKPSSDTQYDDDDEEDEDYDSNADDEEEEKQEEKTSFEPKSISTNNISMNIVSTQSITRKQHKPQRSNPDYTFLQMCTQHNLDTLVKQIVLTPSAFASNIRDDYLHDRIPVIDNELFDELISSHTDDRKLTSPSIVIKTVEQYIALQLHTNITVRKLIRRRYMRNGTISTMLTQKGINEIIDETHIYYCIKYISNKPIDKLHNTSQYMLMQRAESDGYLTINIELPQYQSQSLDYTNESFTDNNGQNLFNLLAHLYITDSPSMSHTQVKNIQKSSLIHYINKYGTKLGESYIRYMLAESNEKYVIQQCDQKLHNILQTGMYHNKKLDEKLNHNNNNKKSTNYRIFSLIYGTDTTPTSLVVLNQHGILIDTCKFHFLKQHARAVQNGEILSDTDQILYQKKKTEISQLLNLVSIHKPILLLIDTMNIGCIQLKNELINKILVQHDDIDIQYVDYNIGKLYQTSYRSTIEYGTQITLDEKLAVMNGRFVINPINELCELYNQSNEILLLNLHYLQKRCNVKYLLNALQTRLIRVINTVGLNLNSIISYPYQHNSLQFICGLGPLKSKQIIDFVRSVGGSIITRDALLHSNNGPLHDPVALPCTYMSGIVYRNCAGFIRINKQSTSLRRGEKYIWSPLEVTRIHPEYYDLADFLCAGSIDEDVQQQIESQVDSMGTDDELEYIQSLELTESEQEILTDQRRQKYIDSDIVSEMIQSKNHHVLEELNLEWVQETERYNYNRTKLIKLLTFIKNELKQPFYSSSPYQHNYKSLHMTRLFYLLTNQTPYTLRVGLLLPVTITSIVSAGLSVKLDNIRGFIRTQNIDAYPYEQRLSRDESLSWLRSKYTLGQTIECRLIKLEYDKLLFDGSMKSYDIKQWSREQSLTLWQNERVLYNDTNECDIELYQIYDMYQDKHKLQQSIIQLPNDNDIHKLSFLPRNIVHTNYHNYTQQQCITALSDSAVGDCIIRPSATNPNSLTAVIKVDENDIYWNYNLVEHGKNNLYEIGTSLIAQVNKQSNDNTEYTYSDIDEFIVSFVERLMRYINDIKSNNKFKYGNINDITNILIQENKTSQSIPYALHYNQRDSIILPGGMIFTYLPKQSQNIKSIPFSILPTGYKFDNKQYTNVDHLISAIKRKIASSSSKPSASKQPPQVQPQRPPHNVASRFAPPPVQSQYIQPPQPSYYPPPQHMPQPGYQPNQLQQYPPPPHGYYPPPPLQSQYPNATQFLQQSSQPPPQQRYPAPPSHQQQYPPQPHYPPQQYPPQQYHHQQPLPPPQPQYQQPRYPPQQQPPSSNQPSVPPGRAGYVNPARLAMMNS